MGSGTDGGRAEGEAPAAAAVRLRLSPAAREALTRALAGRPAGSGIRVWVERGLHPHAQMMIDRASARDLPVTVDGVPLLVDEASVHFLRDASVDYRTDADPPGFEVVGPFLPSGAAPQGSSPPPRGPEEPAPAGPHAEAEGRVRAALRSIYDPEIPMNIVDLGLIYGLDWSDRGDLAIRMTMTSPGCPAVDELVREVERAARAASGAASVRVEIVWEPPWGPERMTALARRQFGYA
jgi:metal-sulfur cluster biosynthetic enzyme/Fe-S cluster assembly iron-binding protein IscA